MGILPAVEYGSVLVLGTGLLALIGACALVRIIWNAVFKRKSNPN